MRPTREFTAGQAARDGAGLHYTSAEWREIASGGDWQGSWPEIDRHGILTGNEVGSVGNYLNVADEAMIPVAEAVAGGWVIDREEGRAEPPRPRYEYSIERDGTRSTRPVCYQEVAMIEAASLIWVEAEDMPEGVEFARLDFGGIGFTVYRKAE